MSRHHLFLSIPILFVLAAAITSVSAALSATQEQQLNVELNRYSLFVNRNADALYQHLGAAAAAASCTAGGYSIICAAPGSTVSLPAVNFSRGFVSGSNDAVQVRLSNTAAAASAAQMSDICAVNSIRNIFATNFNESNGSLISQYVTAVQQQQNQEEEQAASSSPETSYIFGSWPAESTSCPPYNPIQRPFFTSGQAGPKDIVILIDVSTIDADSAWRLRVTKKMAVDLLKALSHRDYVQVVAFSSTPKPFASQLWQGTSTNVGALVARVDNLTLAASQLIVPSLGSALQAANELLSGRSGVTSNCTQLIALFSSGNSDYASSVPLGSVMQEHENRVVVFSIWVDSNMTHPSHEPRRVRLATLACNSNGLLLRVQKKNSSSSSSNSSSSNNEHDYDAWTAIFTYLSAMAPAREIRVSEFYRDAFTGEEVVSLSSNVVTQHRLTGIHTLRAVVTADVSLRGILAAVPGITPDDFNGLMLSQSICQSLNQHSAEKELTVRYLQATVGGGTCDRLDVERKPEQWRSWYSGAVAGSVLVPIAAMILLVVFSLNASRCAHPDDIQKSSQETRVECACVCSVWFVVFLVISLSVFWSLVFPDITVRDTWVETRFVVAAAPVKVASRCCRQESCTACTNAPNGSVACTMALSLLRAGECSDGPQCCANQKYSCNCRQVYSCTTKMTTRPASNGSSAPSTTTPAPSSPSSNSSTANSSVTTSTTTRGGTTTITTTTCKWSTQCSTCYRCLQRVDNRSCTVKCGTCHDMSSAMIGEYEGHMLTITHSASCGMDDAACVADFEAKYAVGSHQTRYVNPSDPEGETRESVAIAQAPFGAWVAMTVLLAIGFVMYLLLVCAADGSTFLRIITCRLQSCDDGALEPAARKTQSEAETMMIEKKPAPKQPYKLADTVVVDTTNVTASHLLEDLLHQPTQATTTQARPPPISGAASAPAAAATTSGAGDDNIAPPVGGYGEFDSYSRTSTKTTTPALNPFDL